MKLAWFGVEEWLNPMDSLARINLGSSCVSALRMDELFRLTGEDEDAFLEEMRTMSLHYHHGDATGSPRVKQAVCGLYPKGGVTPGQVMMVHGGTGANELVIMSLLEQGDNCVVVKPSYQQHYDIPKGIGIETRIVQLRREAGYQLDPGVRLRPKYQAHHSDKPQQPHRRHPRRRRAGQGNRNRRKV